MEPSEPSEPSRFDKQYQRYLRPLKLPGKADKTIDVYLPWGAPGLRSIFDCCPDRRPRNSWSKPKGRS